MAELGSSRPGLALPGEAEPGVSAGGTTTITPSTGSLALTGQPVLHNRFTPRVTALAITGEPVRIKMSIVPSTGSLTLTGQQTGAASQSQIISKEYTGDGASTRSFNSLGFLPLFVIVVGKDGSGNVVGALKSPFMPAGESQPFSGNQAAGAASRLNRIISIDVNGFTVGPDLNVTGRKYAYIMFPAGRFGAVTEGTYLGNSVNEPGHAVLGVGLTQINGVPPGSTQFVKPQYCNQTWYRPGGNTPYTPGTPLVLGGRRMIRDSDNAVLAEATVYINDSSCDGVGYILGNEANWHWEEQFIELHTLVPDLLLITADDATGNAVPATTTPPPTDSTQGWDGNAPAAGNIFFESNTESVLHIFTVGGGALAFNLDGKRYHWYALKGDAAGSGGVLMKTFQYTGTGDGPYPIDLVGCGFDPEWAYLQAANDQFHWSKRTTNIVGANASRRWMDGTGDHVLTNPAYTINFITDGVRFPATNSAWNNVGIEYTVTLIGVAAPLETTFITPAAGALILAGQTPTIENRAIRPNTGALQFTGQLAQILKQIFITVGTAVSTGGTGGVYDPNVYDPNVYDGGSGDASLNLVGQQPILRLSTVEIMPSAGALTLTGRQPVQRIAIRPNTGAVNLTGQQAVVRQSVPPIAPNTGSLTLTGQTPTFRIAVAPPNAGTLVLTGQLARILQQIYITVGTALGTGGPPVGGIYSPSIFDPGVFNTGSAGPAESLRLVGQQPILRIATVEITPNTGSLALTGQQPILKTTIIPRTGALRLTGEASSTKGAGSITPQTGSLLLTGQASNISGDRAITPGTGELNLVGRQPIQRLGLFPNTGQITSVGQEPDEETEFFRVPFVGSLVLTGYQPTVRVRQPGDVDITPECGSLVLDGQPCTVQRISPAPPVPPGPGPVVGGGIGLPTPRKLPFWPKTIITARGRIIEPAGSFRGRAQIEEDELAIFLE